MAISGGEICIVGYSFVDNTDQIQTATCPDVSPAPVYRKMQEVVDTWGSSLAVIQVAHSNQISPSGMLSNLIGMRMEAGGLRRLDKSAWNIGSGSHRHSGYS